MINDAVSQFKTDQQLAKTRSKKRMEVHMTDQELKDLVASIAIEQKITVEQIKKTDEQMKKTDEKLKKTDEKLNRIAEMLGGVSNNQGKVAEEFFYNSLSNAPVIDGIQFDIIMKNVNRKIGKIKDEYDILLIGTKVLYVIEVKYKLHRKDIEGFLDKKLPNFRKLFMEYRDYEIRIGFASFSIDDDTISLARIKEITLLQRRGDVFETLAA